MRHLDESRVHLYTILLGLVMGVLVTSTSVGAGAIGVTVLLLLHPRMLIARIVGSDIAHAVPPTLAAGGGHWLLGSGQLEPARHAADWLDLRHHVGHAIWRRVASDGVVRTALALTLIAVAIKLLW